jgi:hypothetical protein
VGQGHWISHWLVTAVLIALGIMFSVMFSSHTFTLVWFSFTALVFMLSSLELKGSIEDSRKRFHEQKKITQKHMGILISLILMNAVKKIFFQVRGFR